MGPYGIAGFVDGLVQGRDTRNRWEDRRRRHRVEDDRAAREAERHRWAGEDQAHVAAERRRAIERRQREEAAARAAYQATVDARAPERTLGIGSALQPAPAPPPIEGGRGIAGALGRPELVGQAGSDGLSSGGGQMARGQRIARERAGTADLRAADRAQPSDRGQMARAPDRLVAPQATPGRADRTLLRGSEGRNAPGASPSTPDTFGVTTPSETPAASLGVVSALGRTADPAGRSRRRPLEESFLETYMRVGVPQLVEHFLSTGQVEMARTFRQWVRDDDVQRGMQAWARATAAAARGDERGFLHHAIAAYNTDGYFEDGRELLEDRSGWVVDDAGNRTGIRLTFRDTETGETFEQVFDDMEDLYRQAIFTLSPEQVISFGMSELQATREAEAKRLERLAEENDAQRRRNEALELEGVRHLSRMELQILKDRLESGRAGGNPQERYQELREAILEASAGLEPMTPGDLDAQIRALMEAEERTIAYFEQTGSLPSPAAGNEDYRLR